MGPNCYICSPLRLSLSEATCRHTADVTFRKETVSFNYIIVRFHSTSVKIYLVQIIIFLLLIINSIFWMLNMCRLRLEFYIIIKSSQWPFEVDTIITTIFTESWKHQVPSKVTQQGNNEATLPVQATWPPSPYSKPQHHTAYSKNVGTFTLHLNPGFPRIAILWWGLNLQVTSPDPMFLCPNGILVLRVYQLTLLILAWTQHNVADKS